MKVKQERHQHLLHDASDQFGIGRDSCSNNFGYHQNGSSVMGDKINGKFYYGMPSAGLSSCTRNLTDVISFAGRLGRPVIGIHALKPTFKSSRVSLYMKLSLYISLFLRTNSNGRGQGSCTEVKKKRTEESSEVMLKKPKQDQTSTASSTKVQAPKVKLSDRITTLQQIVSPFGKTDTASVLFEAIGCIKFLQEQIQLLSNSYMKTNSHKDGWGSLDRKEKDVKVDLRSRGLCLVPISFTPQLYTDNTAPDYWTPPYRGCFYR
ncbi:transcription factor bHLH111 [Senna tora]|uniref:Transcription factor bHLH111 n=1 Tax=Senna tora TaxID=362788 RepID=A0A834SSK5_9FABA|nr:transcription factor bHLH111 [Senna tora]